MDRDHWDELFDETYLTAYGPRFEEFDSAAEATAAISLAGVEPPAEVLDAPGGFGRHAIPLAEAGYRVTVVDRSSVQLEEGRRRAGDAEWPSWVQADVRNLPFENERFDAVLNLFTAIGYRGEQGDRQMLAEFLRVLRPGGALVIETLHRDRLMAMFQERSWEHGSSGAILAEERRFDYLAGEVETDQHLIVDGARRTIAFRLRVYTATELARLLADAGFAEIEAFGDYDGGELSRDTRLVARATRPAR